MRIAATRQPSGFYTNSRRASIPLPCHARTPRLRSQSAPPGVRTGRIDIGGRPNRRVLPPRSFNRTLENRAVAAFDYVGDERLACLPLALRQRMSSAQQARVDAGHTAHNGVTYRKAEKRAGTTRAFRCTPGAASRSCRSADTPRSGCRRGRTPSGPPRRSASAGAPPAGRGSSSLS